MGLETDIKAAKGHIANTADITFTSGSGVHPALWFGDDAVDGTISPWANVPVGSLYIYKASESAEPLLYQKLAAATATADWFLASFTMGAQWRVKKIAITTKDGNEIDTGWDLPAKSIVYDVYVDVTTAEATGTTKTIDVGLLSSESGGDADGFLDGVVTSAIKVVGGSVTYTDGGSQNYISAHTLGVLLYEGLLGADGAGTAGTINRRAHLASSVTAKSVSYTVGSAATELVGNIYIVYLLLGV